jgi:superfamily II DNA or RNA helicase
MQTLRDYQVDCINKSLTDLLTNKRSLTVLPTGTGKTTIFATIAAEYAKTGLVIIIANRTELVEQAAQRVYEITGIRPQIERAHQRAADLFLHRPGIICASVQTLNSARRMERIPVDMVNLLVFDEADLAIAPSYTKIADHFKNAHVYGTTATADRSDKRGLGALFKSVAYRMDIADAVGKGWLVPVRYNVVRIKDMSLAGVHTVAGDLKLDELEMEIERRVGSIAPPLLELSNGRCTIAFTPGRLSGRRLTEILNRLKPHVAQYVDGETPEHERRAILSDYANRRFDILVNVSVFTRGFDCPNIEVVANARPTKSRALYAQILGRGTRTLPGVLTPGMNADERVTAIAGSRKPMLDVIDFTGDSGKHQLVNPIDILGGNLEQRVRDRAARIAAAHPENDVGWAINKAKSDIADLDERAKEAYRQRMERQRKEAEQRQHIKPVVRYGVSQHDAFSVLDITPSRKPMNADRLITQAQMDLLGKFGVDANEVAKLTTLQANELFANLRRRRNEGLATYKQCRYAKNLGIDASKMSIQEASVAIDRARAQKGLPVKPKQVAV